ncbi:MAG: CCDC90 family protein [Geminicoccaceae bacterium]|nr:CCDC90 family protein [Geminicoccaceae bacterium]
MTLDTLRIVKRLKEAGLDERQAEAITEVLRESRELDLAQIATKADLALLRAEMQALRTELLGEMDRRFAAMDARFAAFEGEMDRRFAAVDGKLAVLQAELGRLEWMIGGVGFGLLLLIVRSFWPGAP